MSEETQPVDNSGGRLSEGEAPTQSFTVPEGYQDKGWAANIKSNDDLWRELDTLQPLIGKKTIPDDSSSDEDWQNFYNNFRPESSDKYEFELGEDVTIDDEIFGKYKEVFHEIGLSNKQAQRLLNAHIDLASQAAPDVSEDGFAKLSDDAFGDSKAQVINNAKSLIGELPEDQAQALHNLPNAELVSVLSLLDKVHKKYSREDSPITNPTPSSQMGKDDIVKQMSKVRQEFREIDPMDFKGREMKKQELENLRTKLSRIVT